MKRLAVVDDAPKKITEVQFGLLSPLDVRRLAHLQVVNRELFVLPERTPYPFGVLDSRLGVSSDRTECATCGKNQADCAGHFGFYRLELPVFHIGYFKSTLNICQTICKSCSRVLLGPVQYVQYLSRARRCIDGLARRKVAKEVQDRCKKVRYCPYCGVFNGQVKKNGPFRMTHAQHPRTKTGTAPPHVEGFHASLGEAVRHNKDIRQLLWKAQDDLTPFRVLRLFENITVADCELLDIDSSYGRPEHMIVTHILVPPVCIRPSVAMGIGQGSTEDDITMKLKDIIHANTELVRTMSKGGPLQTVMEQWDFLQLHCALYINSEISGLPFSMQAAKQPSRSFVQRLKGKQGRFRGNLSGKRVDYTGRTVISPDPNLEISQVAIPQAMARVLTFPETVNRANMSKLKQLVKNGSKHPGANFVEKPGGRVLYLKHTNARRRGEMARDLKMGDTVRRHIMDGDIVLFNRQPSLHRLSIMAHSAKIMPWRTLRFNECVCAPYNADFDGDEMNIHVPQTLEARAEAAELMGVTHNLVTPRNGNIIVAATQDFLTAAWLLTKKNSFFDRATFAQLCGSFSDAATRVVLPPPAILAPLELWTGKQVFSVLLAPTREPETLISLNQAARNYTSNTYMCRKDGYVAVRNSRLLCGSLDKKLLGDGGKNSIFAVLMREVSSEYAAVCMSRLAKFTSRYLMNKGFSIGIDDVMPGERLVAAKEKLLAAGYAKCEYLISQWRKGELELQAGCNAEESMEVVVNGALSKIREDAGNICVKELHWRNAPLNMTLAGSKGSALNISQMIACVGQQTVGGTRVPNGFVERTLPHFHKKERSPASKGFVANSFFSGLTPSEFFFHTVTGREGLVDTAVKTADTGYMQRRLMKSLEDLWIDYDATVRNSERGIVQFVYGDDGLDPIVMEGSLDPTDRSLGDCSPVDFNRCLLRAQQLHFSAEDESLTPTEITTLARDCLKNAPHLGSHFLERALHFVGTYAQGVQTAVETADEIFCEADADARSLWLRSHHLSRPQLDAFLQWVLAKHRRARGDPGTAVGALAAQSIGEPGTQMTLKTFHFAGVASMNITLGVPRIKEIINASKNISTPIITAVLDVEDSEAVARIVKGRLERTLLGQVCRSIEAVLEDGQSHIAITLDTAAIATLHLSISVSHVRSCIIHSKLKITPERVRTLGSEVVEILPSSNSRAHLLYELQHLRAALPGIIVTGIPTVSRAVLHKDDAGKRLSLLVEGTGLQEVMATVGVKGEKTTSNHIVEVEHTLGIEAARHTIMHEIRYVMGAYGMDIDARHVMLLADVMTYRGHILGITRFGVKEMKESVLMLASFEQTTEHLFDAAVHARKDRIQGVSECIIMGIPVNVGTGCFKLIHRLKHLKLPRPAPLLFASTERK